MKCPGHQNFMGIVAPEKKKKKKSGVGKQRPEIFINQCYRKTQSLITEKRYQGKRKIPKIGSK